MRVTEKDLENIIEHLNEVAGPGYELDNAYGGYRLWKRGSYILNTGYISKRDLYEHIASYIKGIELGLELALKLAKIACN